MSELISDRKLFGTDGIRGDAETLLTDELVETLGRAAVRVLGGERTRMAILRDTRVSGERIESALARGAAAAGADVKLAGVLPTPAAPVLIEHYGFDLVAVVSASHNPFADNGIKFFGADGLKLSDATESAIEAELDTGAADAEEHHGSVTELHGAIEDYLRALQQRFAGLDLAGERILLDTANGATFCAAPEIMRRLGASVDVIFDEPDGVNINAGCGSTHLGAIRDRMREATNAGEPYSAGFAFDGDGDRVLAVDRDGRVHDGDELLALAAVHLREQGRLSGDGVVVTVMTNYGFHRAMEAAGINVAVTPVGDRYVLAELLERDWTLGGEQSGHVIDRGFVPSGDGTASALLALEALAARHGHLHDVQAMDKLPQTLVNVRVADRGAIDGADAVWQAVDAEQSALAGRGRVLVRPSGTEPLVRVMAEAPTAEEADAVCTRLAELIERELG
ncbi:MAG: phosphoglucosamine mutase [Actinobacteria bacterium]|nr:phosphoglucosamine mutase [Actinomycetota bacterium]